MRLFTLLALLLFVPLGCRSVTGRDDVGFGEFIGVTEGSGEHWRAALHRPARNAVCLSLVAAAAALQVDGADKRWQRDIQRHSWMPGTEQGKASDVGSWLLVSAPLVAPLLAAPHPDRGVGGRAYAATAAYALGANLALNQVIRTIVNRERPSGANFSFYSGHTTAAFTGAHLLYRQYGWKVGVPAYVTAGMVGMYRIEADRHWPADVLVGAAMGILVTDLIYEKNHGDGGLFSSAADVALVPIVNRERMGLALSWTG